MNINKELALSGLRTGLGIIIAQWIILLLDGSLINMITSVPVGFFGTALLFLAVGALYGSISKKGGIGALNGTIIGILSGIITQLFSFLNQSLTVGSFVIQIIIFGILGAIVGAVIKRFFDSNQISTKSRNETESIKTHTESTTIKKTLTPDEMEIRRKRKEEKEKIYRQKVLKAKGRCIICSKKLSFFDRVNGETYCPQHKATQ